MDEGIFRVEVNETGYYWIRRFSALATVILVLTILVSGANVLSTFIVLLKANRASVFSSTYRWRYTGSLSYLVLNFLLQVLQVGFYKRFGSHSSRAIAYSDTELFNSSFRWLYFQGICFLIQVVTTLIYFSINYIVYRF